MSVFADMRVTVGRNEDNEPRYVTVPVYGASKDRVVAAIKSENTQNKPIRLPAMSAWFSNIDQAPEMRKGSAGVRRQTYMPNGGLFPDDISVVEQRMPAPYKLNFELSVWASNQDQRHQILEQILMIFNPQIQIQTSDEPFDWAKITQVELIAINNDETVPAGTDRRVTRTNLEFQVPIWISVPTEIHKRYVRDIYVRVAAASQAANTPEKIVSEFDSLGIPYELNFTLDDIDLE
jgi:hypothetical protein